MKNRRRFSLLLAATIFLLGADEASSLAVAEGRNWEAECKKAKIF